MKVFDPDESGHKIENISKETLGKKVHPSIQPSILHVWSQMIMNAWQKDFLANKHCNIIIGRGEFRNLI